VYESLEVAVEKLQRHARSQGYAITTKKSYKDRKGKGDFFKVKLQCDRSGQSRLLQPLKSGQERKKVQDIRPIGCPFGATLRRFPASFQGEEWRLSIDNPDHNHEPSSSDSAHPVHRKADRTPEILTIIEDCLDRAVTASDTAIILQKRYPAANITRQDIYNFRKDIYRKLLRGRSPIQALLERLRYDGHWDMAYEIDPYTNRVTALWFSLKLNHDLLFHNRDGLIIDATYKTNQYGMPLIDVVGHTGIGSSFFVGFAFVESEDKPTYIWVLEQIKALYDKIEIGCPSVIVTDCDEALIGAFKEVFPAPDTYHLLCVWHVNKAVTTNCKPAFRGRDDSEWQLFQQYWTAVLYAPNNTAYLGALSALREKYRNDFQPQLDYLERQWLGRRAEALLAMHTNRVRHFGLTVTSRAESAHAAIKRALKVSTGGLLQVVERIKAKLVTDYQEYKRGISARRYRTNPLYLGSFYAEVRGKVAPNALELVRKERDKLQRGKLSRSCSDYLTTTMGIPCSHLLQGVSQLKLEDIHPHWHYSRPQNDAPEERSDDDLYDNSDPSEDDANDPIYDVEPPRDQRRTKNLPARKKGQPEKSTMRAQSAFERVEKELAAQAKEIADLEAQTGRNRGRKRRATAQGEPPNRVSANREAAAQNDLQDLQAQAHAAMRVAEEAAARDAEEAAIAAHPSEDGELGQAGHSTELDIERVNQIWADMNASSLRHVEEMSRPER
jgi:hypothetical protein